MSDRTPLKLKTFIIRVYGIVQGVGFRPTVSRHAASAGICGTVSNKGSYVEIIAQGSKEQCEGFIDLIKNKPPKRAYILKITSREIKDAGIYGSFRIAESVHTEGEIYISPDIAVCDECKKELFDKHNRRYLHPFINCTNCGPRMTILDGLPYDRERTSMKAFPMCEKCSSEYHDPATRRYDAQPVCCNDCGPEVYILNPDGSRGPAGSAAVTYIRKIIADGGIAAVKGIGGFHLCCDASNENAVSMLRKRKNRPSKPLAVMMRDMETVRRECETDEISEEILTGHQKPILLLKKKNTAASATAMSVAPGNPKLGVMLPYAPVQLLIFDYNDGIKMPDILVMTSANDSGAPICRDDGDAVSELGPLCDAILSNDRLIRVRADDTVMELYCGRPYMIRRSRGYAPLPVLFSGNAGDADNADNNAADAAGPVVLGIGGELKNSFCIGKGQLFYPSPYIGDLGDIRTVAALKETVGRFCTLLEAKPQAIACDMHPAYESRVFAYELSSAAGGVPVFEAQHHYAHILSCMAENDCSGPVIGVSFDGTGYGTDGTIWGGELMLCDLDGFKRLGHITPFKQAGGDISAREGWRIAAAMIGAAHDKKTGADICGRLGLCTEEEYNVICKMCERGVNTTVSTSAGRLFDAVSAVLGIKRVSAFEGEASTALMYAAYSYMEDEGISGNDYRDGGVTGVSALPVSGIDISTGADGIKKETPAVIMPTDRLFEYILKERLSGADTGKLAYEFHLMLSKMIMSAVAAAGSDDGRFPECAGVSTAALSGGVFQNTLLLDMVKKGLETGGYEVLIHSLIPPNDGGIGLGQAVYAANRLNKLRGQAALSVDQIYKDAANG